MRFIRIAVAPMFSALLFVATFFLCGCKPEAVKEVALPAYHTDFASAVKFIADSLASQVEPQTLKAAKEIPVDLFFNEYSAEEAASSKSLQQQLIAAISIRMPDGSFLPLNTRNIQHAELVTLASYAIVKPDQASKAGSWVRLRNR